MGFKEGASPSFSEEEVKKRTEWDGGNNGMKEVNEEPWD